MAIHMGIFKNISLFLCLTLKSKTEYSFYCVALFAEKWKPRNNLNRISYFSVNYNGKIFNLYLLRFTLIELSLG